jgi:hypothetical protein
MLALSVARGILLFMATLALLTAILDGLLMRHVVQPMLRVGEQMSGAPIRPPRLMAFMLERAWARRLYHLLFAALLLAGWWYLGTAAGAARWATLH